MSWNEYHLNAPEFCTPLPVMRGLVSALCERREAVDSEFHASCVSSGFPCVAENRLAEMLFCESAAEIPFREIDKESLYAVPYDSGTSRFFSFMHMFDALFLETLEGFAQTAGYGYRFFTDSTGSASYTSLNDLGSALSEQVTAPHSIHTSATAADNIFQTGLNAAWAAQRARMLKLLRHVKVEGGGFAMRLAAADENGSGATPQSAYAGLGPWTIVDIGFAGWETPVECRVKYHCNTSAPPEERWIIDSASEIVRMTPVFDGCLETSAGELKFDAADLRERDEYGIPHGENGAVYVFDALGRPVSSGANALALSSGTFASWSRGTADIGSSGSESDHTIRGWQALNVQVVYDYEPAFNFKQGE